MSREAHVRFWESAGVKLPRATHLPSLRLDRCEDAPDPGRGRLAVCGVAASSGSQVSRPTCGKVMVSALLPTSGPWRCYPGGGDGAFKASRHAFDTTTYGFIVGRGLQAGESP
jgi:hypothetical protein